MSHRILDVNASQRALQTAQRHGGRAYLDEVERHDPAPEILTLSDVLQGEIALTLKTKGGSEVAVSAKLQTVIIATLGSLLLALGGCAFYLVRTTAIVEERQQTEATIRARDNAELKEMMRDYQAQVVSGFVTTQAYMSAHSNKVQFLTGLLTKEQQRQVYEYDRTHPLPHPPDPQTFKPRLRESQQNE